MAKTKKPDYKFWTTTIINVILVVVLIIGGIGLTQGWFSNIFNYSTVKNGDIINTLNTPQTSPSDCDIDIYPNVIVSGDAITGILNDGSNTFCEIYGYIEGEETWRKLWEGTTNDDGQISNIEIIDTVGIYHFRAICDKDKNGIDAGDCITNEEILSVGVLPPDPTDEDANWNVGDVIQSGGGSGNENTDIYDEITLLPGDNPCTLGIKVDVRWKSWNDGNFPQTQGTCWNGNAQDWQSLNLGIEDSYEAKHYSRLNGPPPTQAQADVCPMVYDDVNGLPWLITVWPTFPANHFPDPGCVLDYEYDYEIYNCECPE